MKLYAHLYNFYTSFLNRVFQVILFGFFSWYFYTTTWPNTLSLDTLFSISTAFSFKVLLCYISLVFISEIFFRYKVLRIRPKITVDTAAEPQQAITTKALAFMSGSDTRVLQRLLQTPEVIFFLERAAIEKKEVKIIEVGKEHMLTTAFTLAKEVSGTYITTYDLFAAYLLLSEETTKLLFTKKLNREDVLQILLWTRGVYAREEKPFKSRAHFWGEGIFDGLVTGWTPETKKYTRNYTWDALREEPLLVGREKEYKEMLEALLKKENNNVLLVGESGVGKDALVKALAHNSYDGTLQGILRNKRIDELLLGPLIAGASNRNELETRLQAIVAEISHASNVIMLIQQFENILGSVSFDVNLAGALMPYLRNGTFPIIATITTGNYKKLVEENPIREVLSVIKIDEPTEKVALHMLFDRAGHIEREKRVIISYKAVKSAVVFANRYVTASVLPGSAVHLISDVVHTIALSSNTPMLLGKKIILEEHIVSTIEQKTGVAVAAPKEAEKDLLLHFEEKMHERIIGQDEGVHVIAESLRRIRSGLGNREKPISFLFLGPTGVGKTETAKTLAALYFGKKDAMLRFDMSEYTTPDGMKRLLGAPPGEGDEKGELTEKIFEKPFSLILLDEFEKAHPDILNLFLQVLDDGRLTDNKGKTVSFANAIIIATSNAGSEFIRTSIQQNTAINDDFKRILLDELQKKGLFRPELLNRFDDIVVFKSLSPSEVKEVVRLLLGNVVKKLAEQDIIISFDESVIEKIGTEGFDPQFGARPLQRYIQNNVEDELAKKMLGGEIVRGNSVSLFVTADTIQFQVS